MPTSAADTEIPYIGNGVTVAFPFPFEVAKAAHFEATIDGIVTTAYTLSGLGVDTGGTCTFTTPPASLAVIVLARIAPYARTDFDYQEGGELAASTLDEDIDRAVMLSQQLATIMKRVPRVKRGSLSIGLDLVPEASALLAWNAGATALVNVDVVDVSPSSVAMTAFGQSLALTASAATARTLLAAMLLAVNGGRTGGSATGSGANCSITAVQCIGGNVLTGAATSFLEGAAMVKTNAAWAVGSAAGGCIDGGACAINTWYRVVAVMRPDTGAVDYALTADLNAPGSWLFTTIGSLPSVYQVYSMLGWVRTNGAGNFETFTTSLVGGQVARYWSASQLDVNTTNPGTARVTPTLSAPPGSTAIVDASLLCATGASYGRIESEKDAAEAPGSTNSNLSAAATGRAAGRFYLPVSSSPVSPSRIGYRFSASDAGMTIALRTVGFIEQSGPVL